MGRRPWSILTKLLLALLLALFGLIISSLTEQFVLPQIPPAAAWPLLIVTVLLFVVVLAWRFAAQERSGFQQPKWQAGRAPFPGLAAFTENDAGVFFGRSAEIREVVDRLTPVLPDRAQRVITLIGPSGAGKTSLVQAGVVPQLRRMHATWHIVAFVVSGSEPVHALAEALAEVKQVRSTQATRPSSILLVVDRAEELARLTDATEADRFLRVLRDAVSQDKALFVIMIMRTEYLNSSLETAHAAMFRDPITIGALSHEQLVEAIVRPAQHVGLRFEAGLPAIMVEDAGTADGLPLLAFALQQLYLEAGSDGVVTLEEYQRLGGVDGILVRQADRVRAELRASDPDAPVLATLLELASVGDHGSATRRVPISDFDAAGQRVLDGFIEARLLATALNDDQVMVQVAHDALLRRWPPLRQAIEVKAGELRQRGDLERWAGDWATSGRHESYLMRNARLRMAQGWAATAGRVPSSRSTLLQDFLDASNRADGQTMLRLSESLARQALSELSTDPERALLLALAAVEECPVTPLARRALTTVLVASPLQAVLRGHKDVPSCVRWSPDGSQLLTSAEDATARIWDIRTGAILAVLNHPAAVRGVAWSPLGDPDGAIATACDDGVVRIWIGQTGSAHTVLHGHHGRVNAVAWAPDGRVVGSVGADGTLRVWDPFGGRQIRQVDLDPGGTTAIAFAPDGATIAVGCFDARILMIAAIGGDDSQVLTGHLRLISALEFSPTGDRLLSASFDRTARIWSVSNAVEVHHFQGLNCVFDAAWSPDGSQIVTASGDHDTRFWDAHTGSEVRRLPGHLTDVRGTRWHPRGGRVATVTGDHALRVWDFEPRDIITLAGHDDWVWGTNWSPDGSRLATGSFDRTAKIWNATDGSLLATLHGHTNFVYKVTWSPDGRRIATASGDGLCIIWDAATGREVLRLRGHRKPMNAVTWSPDGSLLITCSDDGTACLWDSGSGRLVHTLTGHTEPVMAAAWAPDGSCVATGSDDRTIRLWSPKSGKALRVYSQHHAWVRSLAWSPDGTRISSAASDKAINVWDPNTGTTTATTIGTDWARSLAWSPNDSMIVTGCMNGTATAWNADDLEELGIVAIHSAGIGSVSWAPDGSHIATGSRDTTARIWPVQLDADRLTATGRRRIMRSLTAEERNALGLPETATGQAQAGANTPITDHAQRHLQEQTSDRAILPDSTDSSLPQSTTTTLRDG